MTGKRVISLYWIAAYFKNNGSQLERGENSYTSGNVRKVLFDPTVLPYLLRGEVKASKKGRIYAVEVSVDPDDEIIDATCSCPTGQVICHHKAAVCIHAHNNISVTDKACSWNAPRNIEVKDTKTLNDMFPLKQSAYRATTRAANPDEVKAFKEKLNCHLVGFTWLLQEEPENELANLLPSLDDILCSPEYFSAIGKGEYIKSNCKIPREQVLKVAKATVGQAHNANWQNFYLNNFINFVTNMDQYNCYF